MFINYNLVIEKKDEEEDRRPLLYTDLHNEFLFGQHLTEKYISPRHLSFLFRLSFFM